MASDATKPDPFTMSDDQRKEYYLDRRPGYGPPVFEKLPDGRTRGTHCNGVVQHYLPNGAAETVDWD